MMKRTFVAKCAMWALALVLLGVGASPTTLVVEKSEPLPKANGLGTMGYSPTAKEKAYLAKVNEKSPNLWGEGGGDEEAATQQATTQPQATTTQPGAAKKAYTLAGQKGKYVGWFGIVREIKWDPQARQTTLLLEHKYFDGLVDLHIQIVSIRGAGDFTVVANQELKDIPKLGLVRVYGTVKVETDGTVQVSPEFIRTWDWGLFSFMDYGVDHSNPKWVKLRKVDDSDVYSPSPNKRFYEQRLGKRE
ncbi:MAG: hypothetical protein FWD61_17675 [Phycisphaerales bacterium]|nr:hypothetical protein [Phycisphaerales bacterium]